MIYEEVDDSGLFAFGGINILKLGKTSETNQSQFHVPSKDHQFFEEMSRKTEDFRKLKMHNISDC